MRLSIRNPRGTLLSSSHVSCDYCRGPFTLYSRRLSSNVVGQGEQSRVSNPLVDGRWTCACWITCAKLIHPKTSIIRFSTILFVRHKNMFLFRQKNMFYLLRQENRRTWFLLRQENMRTRGRVKAWLSKTENMRFGWAFAQHSLFYPQLTIGFFTFLLTSLFT